MTARNQPHKFRCETCDHYNGETDDMYGMCYAESGHREQMYNNTYDHIKNYGCASHSSATKAEQRIADVIKELQKRESEAECGLTLTDYHKIVSMLHELALLREKGE